MAATRRIDVVLLVVAAVWGSSYLAAKVATSAAPVLVVLFLRYGLSAAMCIALVVARPSTRGGTRAEWGVGAVLGLTQAGVLMLETYGVAHTSAANAGLIISLTIVLTPVLDVSSRTHRLPAAFFTAGAVCLLGVGLLVSAGGLRAPSPGDSLMLGAALVRAAHVALVGRLTTGRAVRPLPVTMVQTVVGTVLFGVAAAGQLPAIAHLDARDWAVLGYLALGCSVFAFLAQTWAVQRTSASRASLLLGTEPVWAVAAGVILGAERLSAWASIGAALVVGGAYWGQSIESRHRATAKEDARCRTTTPTTGSSTCSTRVGSTIGSSTISPTARPRP
jgi:drug/metabolite transporter (DMT)-like permease